MNDQENVLDNHFNEKIEQFAQFLKGLNRSSKTILIYTHSLKYLYDWMKDKGLHHLRELTLERIKDFQRDFLLLSKTNNHSPETIHTRLRGMKRFLEYLEHSFQLLINLAEAIELPKLRAHRITKEVLTEEEVLKLMEIAAFKSPMGMRDRAILELLYSTGIRLQELINLDVDDVDLKSGYLQIRQGKGGKDRVQPLGKQAVEFLNLYLERGRSWFNTDTDKRALFFSLGGKRIGRDMPSQMIKKYLKKAGLQKKVSTHTLRRTFATHLLRRGAPAYHVKELLGHADIKSLEVYIKIAQVDLKKEHTRTHPRDKKEADASYNAIQLREVDGG